MLDNYKIEENGVIKQISISDPTEYSVEYISDRYDSYKSASVNMSYLRLGYLLGSIPKPGRILDVGYGNGDFLSAASGTIANCYGFEVNGYPIPSGCTSVSSLYSDSYDVVCFFDVLEHFSDIYEISSLDTEYIYISVPECHNFSDSWFSSWRHRRPDEHLWHFNEFSLRRFMKSIGFSLVCYSNIEDTLRDNGESYSNILTGIFKRD